MLDVGGQIADYFVDTRLIQEHRQFGEAALAKEFNTTVFKNFVGFKEGRVRVGALFRHPEIVPMTTLNAINQPFCFQLVG